MQRIYGVFVFFYDYFCICATLLIHTFLNSVKKFQKPTKNKQPRESKTR